MSEQCNDTAISQEVAPQSSPFHQPSPRIPYECLYYVVDYLHDDFHTLKSLLYVNKFFFHAVLPYFIRDPYSNSAMCGKWRNLLITSEKFLALILTSFLEARLKESKISPEAGELVELRISGIMEQYGLQLVKPFAIPGHQMLRSFFKRIDDELNTRQNSGDNLKEIGPEMTTDYSKFVTKIPEFDEIPIRAYLMIRLCKLPAETVAGRIQHSQKVDDKVEDHTIPQQLDYRYKTELYDALTKLWNHYNRQHILSYSLDMSLAQNLLSFSKEMAKLQNLRLDRPLDMTDSHLENTVLFIKQNREAFPRKRLLNIEFGNNWNIPIWIGGRISNANLEVVLAEIKSRRDKTFEHMKPVMAIYEAAGDLLKEIHITNIPYFYEWANGNGIKADHLILISDIDEDRIDQGEGPSMEVFLRRCPRVRTLQIGAGSPDILSWAADEALSASDLEKIGSIKLLNDKEQQSQQKPQVRIAQRSTTIFGCLETLQVSSSRPYRFGIQVVNDISVASSTSLQEIYLSVNYDDIDSSVPTAVKRQHIKKSFQLHDVPSANRIGSWQLLLPHLRSIRLILTHVASIQVGSFDQSPNLEELEIQFGGIPLLESKPSDGEELPLPESDEYLDHRWQQARIDSTLFPKWNLPKLKVLILYGSAASRFDFTSLCSMENLERLDLGWSEITSLIGMGEYKRVQSEIWKERLESALDKESGRLNPLDAVKPWMWPLPKLKLLNMDGPPATMFSLDWLLVCPKLQFFDLGEPMEPQVIGSVPFFAKGFETQDGKDDNGNSRYRPYMDSRISHVELKAGWRMSSEDLKRLLTIYTPFICSLTVDRIDENRDGYSFLKAIKEADNINRVNAMCEREWRTESGDYVAQARRTQESNLRRPGQNLNRVRSNYSYHKVELRKLNLAKVDPGEEEKYYLKNLRVYSMLNRILVEQDGSVALNNGSDSEGNVYWKK